MAEYDALIIARDMLGRPWRAAGGPRTGRLLSSNESFFVAVLASTPLPPEQDFDRESLAAYLQSRRDYGVNHRLSVGVA